MALTAGVHPVKLRTGCEISDASSLMLKCADYESEDAVAADLDNFCSSQCFRKAKVS